MERLDNQGGKRRAIPMQTWYLRTYLRTPVMKKCRVCEYNEVASPSGKVFGICRLCGRRVILSAPEDIEAADVVVKRTWKRGKIRVQFTSGDEGDDGVSASSCFAWGYTALAGTKKTTSFRTKGFATQAQGPERNPTSGGSITKEIHLSQKRCFYKHYPQINGR